MGFFQVEYIEQDAEVRACASVTQVSFLESHSSLMLNICMNGISTH